MTRHLGTGCTEQEREDRAVDAAQLLQAFREGSGIDLSGVVIRGDLSLDLLHVGPLPPELEGMKELQGRAVRVIPGSMRIVNSVMRGAIRHESPQGLLVVKGPVTFSGTRFEQLVDLSRALFLQPVTLSGARFLRESYFVQGRFLRDVFAEKTAFRPAYEISPICLSGGSHIRAVGVRRAGGVFGGGLREGCQSVAHLFQIGHWVFREPLSRPGGFL